MVWTRLFYTTLPAAFKKTRIPNTQTFRSEFSLREQALLRKTFRMNGVPWIYDQAKEPVNVPRDKKPKMSKRQRNRPMQLAKIQKALQQVEAKKAAFLQQRISGRPIKGFDKFVASVLPSLIKKDSSNVPKHLQRRTEDYED